MQWIVSAGTHLVLTAVDPIPRCEGPTINPITLYKDRRKHSIKISFMMPKSRLPVVAVQEYTVEMNVTKDPNLCYWQLTVNADGLPWRYKSSSSFDFNQRWTETWGMSATMVSILSCTILIVIDNQIASQRRQQETRVLDILDVMVTPRPICRVHWGLYRLPYYLFLPLNRKCVPCLRMAPRP